MYAPQPTPNRRAQLARIALVILLLSVGAEFTVRGPLRFAHAANFNDFISPYIQSRAWLHGEDPYSPQNLVRLWPPEAERFDFLSRDLADGTLVLKRGIPTAYPLSALALIAPLAVLPWHIAQPLWLAITVLSFVVTIASLLSVAKLLSLSRRALLFLALALALAPFHTALAAGSIVSVAVAASAAAIWAANRRREVLAGVLLALAVGLKPQIGLPFCLYYLIRRRWRIPAVAVGLPVMLFAFAALRCLACGTPWLQNYLYDNRILFAPGSLGDFTESNPMRFGLINLQVAAYTLLHNRNAATAAAIAVAAAASMVWLFLVYKRNERSPDLLALSALVVLSLVPIYHRFYDASLLIFPLAWTFTVSDDRFRKMARTVLLVILVVFLVPGGTVLEEMQQAGHFATLKNYWWWNTLVLPHESWSILLLAVLLLLFLQRKRSTVVSG